jgi:hypothetical protein
MAKETRLLHVLEEEMRDDEGKRDKVHRELQTIQELMVKACPEGLFDGE